MLFGCHIWPPPGGDKCFNHEGMLDILQKSVKRTKLVVGKQVFSDFICQALPEGFVFLWLCFGDQLIGCPGCRNQIVMFC